jgi:hypothetical protein
MIASITACDWREWNAFARSICQKDECNTRQTYRQGSPDWNLARRIRKSALDSDDRIDGKHEQVERPLDTGNRCNDVPPGTLSPDQHASNVSAGTISERSSAATSLKVSGSTGVGRPAKAYAAHIAIHADAKAIAINTREPPMSRTGAVRRTLLASRNRVDVRESEDEDGHCKHERHDVERKECIQGGAEQVERVVIQRVPD